MSYLSQCDQIRPMVWRIHWRGVTGTIYTDAGYKFVSYKRYTALGQLLFWNNESEKHFIACAIERETGTRPIEWRGV